MTSCLDLYMCCWWSIFCALLSRARRRVLQGPISGFPFCRGLCFHRSELDGAVLVPLFSRALYKREADEWMFVSGGGPHARRVATTSSSRRWRRRRQATTVAATAVAAATASAVAAATGNDGGTTGRQDGATIVDRWRQRRRQQAGSRGRGSGHGGGSCSGRGWWARRVWAWARMGVAPRRARWRRFARSMPMTLCKNCSLNARNQVKSLLRAIFSPPAAPAAGG